MNGFVVTYGPEPKLWCTRCRNDTRLVARLDGTLRPGDVEQAQCRHVCGPLASRWDQGRESWVSVSAGQGVGAVKRFLVSDGSNARIYCCACHKGTRMVPAPSGEVTDDEIAYYKRIHVCGPSTEPWDVERAKGRAS